MSFNAKIKLNIFIFFDLVTQNLNEIFNLHRNTSQNTYKEEIPTNYIDIYIFLVIFTKWCKKNTREMTITNLNENYTEIELK